jgi:RNA polymerase sigma factor (sigma-70 family)
MYSETPGYGIASPATVCAPCSPTVSTRASRRLAAPKPVRVSDPRIATAENRVVCIEPQVVLPSPRDLQWLNESDLYLLQKLVCEPFEYVDHPMFDEPETEASLFGSRAVLSPGSTWFMETDRSRPGTGSGSVLDGESERLLFQQFNYARRRVGLALQAHAKRRMLRPALEEMIAWMHRALMVRGCLAQANIPLVLSMAKRSQFGGQDSSEVLSAGNYALLRSIDRFDWSRGYKFSTYACQGIIQRILHVVDATRRYRNHFVSEYDETLERDDSTVRRHEAQEADWLEELRDVLAANRAGLSALERLVIQHRFGFVGPGTPVETEGKTLKEIGEIMGVTKERVRQIQKRALEKLRGVMERECLAA